MSESFPEDGGSPSGRGFGGTVRKYWWVGGIALAAGLGFFWWKNRQGAASSSGTSSSADTSSADSSGIDYSGQLSTIQTELESVLAGQSAGAAGGGGTTGTATSTTGTTGTTGSSTGTPQGQGPPSGGSGSGSSTGSTGGGTMGTVPPVTTIPVGAVKPAPPGLPHGITVTRKTPTQVGLAWTPVATATDYRCRVTYQGKLVSQKTAKTPAITIDGLTPDHTYTFHVAASNAGGTGPETSGPAVKTPRS